MGAGSRWFESSRLDMPRRADPFFRYVHNLLGRLGNRVEMRLGASPLAVSSVWVPVDSRDGFEVALPPCTSAASQQAKTSSPPSQAG